MTAVFVCSAGYQLQSMIGDRTGSFTVLARIHAQHGTKRRRVERALGGVASAPCCSMLKALRRLFVAETPAEPLPADGKVTLADVLRRGWLEQWYQPKIELKTMRLAGAEGLARARHPDGRVLPPGVFLPGAGDADMLALTERAITTALADWDEFAANGMSVKLAVNVPVSALVSLPIADMVRAARPKTESWPGLILEVTEDEIIRDLKLANDAAARLQAAHCSLALDDFGAGYSSIARLRQLPFSELKIDRAYVMNCHVDRVNAGLCEVFVELASASASRPWPRASRPRTRATSCRRWAPTSGRATCSPSRCRRAS